MVQWLLHSDAGLLTRIAIGCGIFAVLAWSDFRRHGTDATRWREYSVLLLSLLAALSYGAINDQVTVTISPEYFLYGKELFHVIGDQPSECQLRWEAAKVGLKASWSPGLIFGVMLLLANNPFETFPRLRNRKLVMYLPLILLTAASCGLIGGWLGYHGYLTRLDSDFQDLVEGNIYHPRRFMCCWGVHLGGYVGGLLGAVAAVSRIILYRRRAARALLLVHSQLM